MIRRLFIQAPLALLPHQMRGFVAGNVLYLARFSSTCASFIIRSSYAFTIHTTNGYYKKRNNKLLHYIFNSLCIAMVFLRAACVLSLATAVSHRQCFKVFSFQPRAILSHLLLIPCLALLPLDASAAFSNTPESIFPSSVSKGIDKSLPIVETIIEFGDVSKSKQDSKLYTIILVSDANKELVAGAKFQTPLSSLPSRYQLYRKNLLIPENQLDQMNVLDGDLFIEVSTCSEIAEKQCVASSIIQKGASVAKVASLGDGSRRVRIIPYITMENQL